MRAQIIVLGTIVITAIGCMQSTNPISAQEVVSSKTIAASVNSGPSLFMDQSSRKIFYAVGSRFLATVKKADLHKATSILDFVPKEETEGLESYTNVKVGVLKKDGETIKMGTEATLNKAQLKLLRSTDYSTDFYINADAKKGTYELWEQSTYDLVYYFTIIPEKEAAYQDGNEALVDFVKKNTKKLESSIIADQLKAGKVRFTISKSGTVSGASLDSSCGFESLDKAIIDLLGSSPGKWTPATNGAGENVEQELVFSFGITGC
ncbi:MAG: hypothetical protein ACI9FU_002259 [Granulosicoccus sp.]|jgi:hypothetical protein